MYLLPLLAVTACSGLSPQQKEAQRHWEEMKEVEASIELTEFPDAQFDITQFGAVAGSDASEAIRAAIQACNEQGGGHVIIPADTFYTKAIHLLSNVDLHLEEGAVLKFSTCPSDYLPQVPSSWEGQDLMGLSPLIYANGQTNIAVTGKGLLDGQASRENWWQRRTFNAFLQGGDVPLMGKAKLRYYEQNNTPLEERIFTEEDGLRPQFIQFYRCNRILIADVTLNNAPFWQLHPLMSKNIVVRGVTMDSHGPNNDGCDPESCENVLIEDCVFDTGDDCIAIKSGRNNDGRNRNMPSRNLIVRNSIMKDGHAAVAIGSEISGSCYNVWFENCVVGSPNMNRPFRIKSNAIRGGVVKGFYIRNIEISECNESVVRMELAYERVKEGPNYPTFEDVFIQNVTCQKAPYGILIDGLDEPVCIHNIYMENCRFDGIENEEVNHITSAADPIMMKDCWFNGVKYPQE